MRTDPWPKKYQEKLKTLNEMGNRMGVRKLQFGRYIFWMRALVPLLSQTKAAKLAGISRSQWLRMEDGKHLPRAHKIPDIAKAIRVDIRALYRKAGYEIPKQYVKYNRAAAIREFTHALQECFAIQEFFNRVQIIWQEYHQAQTGKQQRIYVDPAQSQILEQIYERMTVPQRIRLAYEIIQDAKRRDVRAAVPDAQVLFDNLDRLMELLREEK
jgi:transcriptional regulator with XRE-family HTH domain